MGVRFAHILRAQNFQAHEQVAMLKDSPGESSLDILARDINADFKLSTKLPITKTQHLVGFLLLVAGVRFELATSGL